MGRSLDRRRDAGLVAEVGARLLSLVPRSVRHDVERAVRDPVGTVVDIVSPRRCPDSAPGPGHNGPVIADGPAIRVVVTLHAPACAVDGRLDGMVTTVRPLGADRCRLEASYQGSLEQLSQRLLMLGFEFEVHEPRELSTALRVLSARALRAARDDVDLIWDGR